MSKQQVPVSERAIVFLIAAVQFISVLEFMIVMPLGPDFADALGIHPSKLGLIGGAYTAAAAISGLVSALFIERFDRRKALACAMFALVCATAAAGLAFNLTTLMLARVLAGCFGGPAMALALAIIADTIPPERRGKAMGAVMGSFALASVLGIPAGLELAKFGGWRAPFFAIAALGVAVVAIVIFKLPPLRAHLTVQADAIIDSFKSLLRQSTVRTSFLMTICTMTGMFMVIPNISAYVQGNMGFPRDYMGGLYFAGGLVSFFTMRYVGKLTDRYGAVRIAAAGTLAFSAILFCWFILNPSVYMVLPLFVAMMTTSSFRNVPYQSLTSQIPRPQERARFMSLQSSVQHVSTTCGAFLSSVLLSEGEGGALVGMPTVAWISIVLTTTLPFMMHYVQKQLRQQTHEANVAKASSDASTHADTLHAS